MQTEQTLSQQLRTIALANQTASLAEFNELALKALPSILEEVKACAKHGMFETTIQVFTVSKLIKITLPHLNDYVNVLKAIANILEQAPYCFKTTVIKERISEDFNAFLTISW